MAAARRVGVLALVAALAGGTAAAGCRKRDRSSEAAPPAPPPPTVALTSVSPSSGPIAGGTLVTLAGTGFQAGATVSFGGSPATSLTVVSSTQITCVTPPGPVGPASVTVVNPDATSATLANGFTYVGPAPTLAFVAPTAGPAAGGATVYLTGTNFAAGATVSIGGAAATVVSVTPTTIRAVTGAGSLGTQSVTVTNPDSQAATLASAYTYWGAGLSVSSLSPTSGPNTGGTTITVTGSGFVSGAILEVGGVAATAVTVLSSTQIRGTTAALNPFGPYLVGPVNVGVRNPDAQGAVLVNGFNALGTAPSLSSLAPTSGSTGGGTLVTLTGTGFDPVEDGGFSTSSVSFGSNAATFVNVASTTTITCWTPAGAAGAVNVTVTNADGQASTVASGYTYVAGPGISSVSPAGGPGSGGTTITISGTGFAAGATVTVGGAIATSVAIASSSSITCVTPAGTPGTVHVTVTNPGPVSTTLPFGFAYANGVNAQTAPYVFDTSAGMDCRRRWYVNMNLASFLKDLQNRGLQSWGSPGDTTAPPAPLPLVDQYALDWMRAYVLRTISVVYGRNPDGSRVSGASIQISFVGLPPATGSRGCGTPSTGWSEICCGGCNPQGSGGPHPSASQASCGGGAIGRAHFDNSDTLPCNSYGEWTCNGVYQGCSGCSVDMGVFTANIGNGWASSLSPALSSTDQQYLDGTTTSGARYNAVHSFLQQFARRIAFVTAHEIGHDVGLSASAARGPCTINLTSGQCGATAGHNSCCSTNLMAPGLPLSGTFTDFTRALDGNPAGPSAGAGCSATGASAWAVLQAYLGVSP
ncbi:MAG: IPT/TIG domain-containing protein [Planctomycetales bacterium]|nr:IPT/TIG domain-containing protein [Planctomycetales bacterium]